MHAKIIDGVVVAWPYLNDQIKADNPNVSFPAVLAGHDLSDFGVVTVLQEAIPATKWNERAIPQTPEFFNGSWVGRWVVESLNDEEVQYIKDTCWSSVRAERNTKLVACDWTQVADAPVDAIAWATYRQALRDITTQSNPFSIIWPTQPTL
jgi:hypothetical protein